MILIPVIEVMGDSGGDERMFSAIEWGKGMKSLFFASNKKIVS
jgi:hypothetical protein